MFNRGWLALWVLAAIVSARGQEPSAEEASDRKDRFAYIHEQVNAFELRYATGNEPSVKLTDEPILKYTNPVRSADGVAASYLWLSGTRPIAACCLAIRQDDKVWRELASLSDDSLHLSKAGALIWTPAKQAQSPKIFPGAPAPAESPAQRLIQMRSLARKFSVKIFRDPPIDARLLPQPIHRYSDESAGIQDGALFAWAETTDPEGLLVIEARPEKAEGPAHWYYRFARMTSAGIEARLGETVVFRVESYWRNPRAKTDAYQEAQQIRYGAALPSVGK